MMGFTFFAKTNSESNSLSKQKTKSTSGWFKTMRFKVSLLNLPMPSSLFFCNKRVFTAIRKIFNLVIG